MKLQRIVLESVENFSRGASQADDLTLVLVRYRATAATGDTDPPLRTGCDDGTPSIFSSRFSHAPLDRDNFLLCIESSLNYYASGS